MAAASADVVRDLNELITAITGFKEPDENFLACRKYCLSHLVHHSYPSVSKSAVSSAAEEFVTRFYIHGQFQLSRALQTQLQHFLSHEQTFRSNPECEIEWNLVSLVTDLAGLACNLSQLVEVPRLVPLTEHLHPSEAEPETFDWATHLKEGLPVYNYDTDSDSYSSLSDDRESLSADDSGVRVRTTPVVSTGPTADPATATLSSAELPKVSEARAVYLEAIKQRDKESWLEQELKERKNFASRARHLCWKHGIDVGPTALISEKEAVEMVCGSLLSGTSLQTLRGLTVPSLAKETFLKYLDSLESYCAAVKSFNDFLTEMSSAGTSDGISLVAREYASGLRSALLAYECKIFEIGGQSVRLVELRERVSGCLPFILGLSSTHRLCVTSLGKEPAWRTSLRIVSAVHNGMVETHRADVRAALAALFVRCLAVFGQIMDRLLTSPLPVDPCKEFLIQRKVTADGKDCDYTAWPYREPYANSHPYLFPLVDIVANKIMESRISLSLLYRLKRFADLASGEHFPSNNQSLLESLNKEYSKDHVSEGCQTGTNILKIMSQLTLKNESSSSSADWNAAQITKWMEGCTDGMGVSRVAEQAVSRAVSAQLSAVRALAITIMVQELQVGRHVAMLRSALLHNDASFLLPFIQVFFNQERCWSDAEHLTLLLRECVAADFPELAANVSVAVAAPQGVAHRNIIEAIDCITVLYQVPYPISLVITTETLEKYNAIFRVILKLKWAHTLSRLPFPDVGSDMSPAVRYVSHRLQLVRFSCLADLSVINNYMMTQVSERLPRDCDHYEDVQTLITEHGELLDRMSTQCPLPIVDSMIPLCFELRRAWFLEETDNLIAKLKLMENISRGNHLRLQQLIPLPENGHFVATTRSVVPHKVTNQ